MPPENRLFDTEIISGRPMAGTSTFSRCILDGGGFVIEWLDRLE